MKDCPCGTGFPYTDCCGPLIRGVGYADTAEDLMRSRFTAMAKNRWDYLEKTSCPDDQKPALKSNLRQERIAWTKLEIFGIRDGGASDEEGEVRFAAYYTENGEEKTLRETSKFIKKSGRWYYDEQKSKVTTAVATPDSQPFVRDQPKIGRNDPCPCGSKKKYKKCCGR